MSGTLSINFRGLTAYGADPKRQLHQLEQATREAFLRLQNWIDSGMQLPRAAVPLTHADISASVELSSETNVVNCVDTSTTAHALTMPPHEDDLVVIVKDASSNASANNITLVRYDGVGTIDGVSSSYTLSVDGECLWFMSRDLDWMLIASAT